MTKVLIASDVHIHQHKKNSDRLTHCLDVLRWIFQTAVERDIKEILFLGDLFHDRQKLDTYGFVRTYEIFEEFLYKDPKFNLHLLVGNHDMYFFKRWDISSVKPLRAFPTVTVVEEPCTCSVAGHDVDFLPYTHNPIQDLQKIKSPGHKLLCAHIAVDGAKLNLHHETKSEIQIENDGDMVIVGSDVYANWDQVFLGHYHGAQNIGINAEYVGSPLQLSFGEAFEEKHIIIYDLDSQEKEYVVNDFSPVHYIVPAEDRHNYELEGNFVKILTQDLSASEVVELRQDLETDKVASYEIKPIPQKVDEHIIEDAKAILHNQSEMMDKYVEEVDRSNGLGELDRDKLIKIGKGLAEKISV